MGEYDEKYKNNAGEKFNICWNSMQYADVR